MNPIIMICVIPVLALLGGCAKMRMKKRGLLNKYYLINGIIVFPMFAAYVLALTPSLHIGCLKYNLIYPLIFSTGVYLLTNLCLILSAAFLKPTEEDTVRPNVLTRLGKYGFGIYLMLITATLAIFWLSNYTSDYCPTKTPTYTPTGTDTFSPADLTRATPDTDTFSPADHTRATPDTDTRAPTADTRATETTKDF